jgi:hypothetical protein
MAGSAQAQFVELAFTLATRICAGFAWVPRPQF